MFPARSMYTLARTHNLNTYVDRTAVGRARKRVVNEAIAAALTTTEYYDCYMYTY